MVYSALLQHALKEGKRSGRRLAFAVREQKCECVYILSKYVNHCHHTSHDGWITFTSAIGKILIDDNAGRFSTHSPHPKRERDGWHSVDSWHTKHV